MKRIGMLILLFFSSISAFCADSQIYEYTLRNGLKLIVKEDHRSPVVVSQVWYRVGSSYEHNGITGISHVLEHMMFKGTSRFKAGEFSRIIAANGGRENAFTGRDYTAYFQRLEKSRLKVSFELEADRMRSLKLTDKEFQKERSVVIEERRLRTEDKPTAITYEQFNAVAFQSSPYRIPVIGWMDDLKNLRVEDLQKWYQRWYAPNNATVVVVGDVVPKQVFLLAKKYFGHLKPSRLDPPKPQREPKQLGIRRITVKVPAHLPYLMMGYKTPVVGTAHKSWEPYALEVMAYVLDGGRSSRFTKELIRGKAIAAQITTSYDLHSRLNNLFTIFAIPSQGTSMDALEKAFRRQIDKVKKELVSKSELERAKAQILAEKIFQQDSVFYQAMNLGLLETTGKGWREEANYIANIKNITPEQIRYVANKYFIDDQLTIARLKPLPMSMKKPIKRTIRGGRHAR